MAGDQQTGLNQAEQKGEEKTKLRLKQWCKTSNENKTAQ